MIKYLIAIDMDGTLLNSKKEICPKTAEYLKQLEKNGHIVVIASGRPIRSIIKYYNQLSLHSPVVCYNGANVISPYDKNFKEQSISFPCEIIKSIYNALGPKHIENVMCETNKELWVIKKDEVLESFFNPCGMKVIIGDINQTLNQNPMTMIMKSYSKEDDKYVLEELKKYKNLKLRFWNGQYNIYSEIYHSGVSKSSGLKYIADYYHIPFENIIAIGDASNDIEMFESAGIAIAMKNSDDNTKQHADIVSEFDNDHDGIMFALQKIITLTKQNT